MKKSVLLIPLILATATNIHAQSVGPGTLNATGGTAIIGSNEFEWSVAEMAMVSTFSNTGIIITQGVLQPSDAAIAGVSNHASLSQQLQVFPNPATSIINIQYSSTATEQLTCKLTDMTGRGIVKQTINSTAGTTLQQINISELACATYMLEVTVNSGSAVPGSILYKIQKIK